jgi:hypothetical protein
MTHNSSRMPRIAALLFALAIAVAPVATTVCQAVCAVHAEAAPEGAHACHDEPAKAGSWLGSGTVHLCGHAETLPTALGQALQTLAPPAVLAAPFVIAPMSVRATPAAAAAEHSPPGFIALTSQLRV